MMVMTLAWGYQSVSHDHTALRILVLWGLSLLLANKYGVEIFLTFLPSVLRRLDKSD